MCCIDFLEIATWLTTKYQAKDGGMIRFIDIYRKAVDFFVPPHLTPSKKIVSRMIASLFPESKCTVVYTNSNDYTCYTGLVERCTISKDDTSVFIPNECEAGKDSLGQLMITCPTLNVVNGEIVKCTMTFGKTTCLMIRGTSLQIYQQIDLTQSNVDGLVYLCENVKLCKGIRYDENFPASKNAVIEDWSRFCNENQNQTDQRVRSTVCKIIIPWTSIVEFCSACRNILRCKKKRKAKDDDDDDDDCIVHDMEASEENMITPVETPSLKKNTSKEKCAEVKGEILFGVFPVKLALEAGRRKPHRLFLKERGLTDSLRETLTLADKLGIEKEFVSKEMLDKLSGDRPHQGICLDASRLYANNLDSETQLRSEDLIEETGLPKVWLLTYRVKDPMNFGAILRSAFYLGIDKVLFPKKYSCALSPVVSKASAGALEVMDLACISTDKILMEVLERWKNAGGQVLGTTCDESSDKSQQLIGCSIDVPTIIIVGNEREGLDKDVIKSCDKLLYINPIGNVHVSGPVIDSLNVSVATGIVLYSLMQKRQKYNRTTPCLPE